MVDGSQVSSLQNSKSGGGFNSPSLLESEKFCFEFRWVGDPDELREVRLRGFLLSYGLFSSGKADNSSMSIP